MRCRNYDREELADARTTFRTGINDTALHIVYPWTGGVRCGRPSVGSRIWSRWAGVLNILFRTARMRGSFMVCRHTSDFLIALSFIVKEIVRCIGWCRRRINAYRANWELNWRTWNTVSLEEPWMALMAVCSAGLRSNRIGSSLHLPRWKRRYHLPVV